MTLKTSKIYTKTGDEGLSTLFGGSRVSKNHLRLEVYGTLDETNSHLGHARSELHCFLDKNSNLKSFDDTLAYLQNKMFDLGAELAYESLPIPEDYPQVTSQDIAELEHLIDRYDSELERIKIFILPGGTTCASALHVARTVCRRAERTCVPLLQDEAINKEALIFLNRMSDLLFVLARWINKELGVNDIFWEKK